MKKLIVVIIASSLAIASYAQVNFEGTIKCNITMNGSKGNTSTQQELTPKQKEELNKSITELENKLNDPSMKAIFDSDPYAKALLEK